MAVSGGFGTYKYGEIKYGDAPLDATNDLVIANSSVSESSNNVALTQVHSLTVQGSSHGLSSDSPVIEIVTKWAYQSALSNVGTTTTGTVTSGAVRPNVGDIIVAVVGFSAATNPPTSIDISDNSVGGATWAPISALRTNGNKLTVRGWWKTANAADYNSGSGISVSATESGGSGAIVGRIQADIFRLPSGYVCLGVDLVGSIGTNSSVTTETWSPDYGSSYPTNNDELTIMAYFLGGNTASPTGTNTFAGTSAAKSMTQMIADTHLGVMQTSGVQASVTAGSNVWVQTWSAARAVVNYGFTLAYTSASSTNLVVEDSVNAASSQSVVLTQTHILTVNNGAHVQTAGSVVLVKNSSLVVADSSHVQVCESVVLTKNSSLVVANAAQASASGQVALTQTHSLISQSSSHTTSVGGVTVTQTHNLTIQPGFNSIFSDAPVPATQGALAPSGTTHSTISTTVGLTQTQSLVVQSSTHATKADAITISRIFNLVPQSSSHSLVSPNVVPVQTHILAVSNSSSTTSAQAITLNSNAFLVVNNATHATSSPNNVVPQTHILGVTSAVHILHTLTPDIFSPGLLVISDSNHSLYSSNLTFGFGVPTVWTGTAWEKKPIKVCRGDIWEPVSTYRWTGDSWEKI